MHNSHRDPLVSLEGTPAEVGAAFGSANATDIRNGVEGFFDDPARRDEFLRATDTYRAIVSQYAPHWIEEVSALAAAAGVDADEYLAYQGAKYRGINRPECFTYVSLPRNSAGGVTIFHKNRDNRPRPQSAYGKGVRVAGRTIYRFIATGDTSDLGTMMGLNEKGLAAAADTGYPDPHPRHIGMMNPDLMRLILEQAASVAEAYTMIQEFQAAGIYAGGDLATHWMFADSGGNVLRVAQYHESLEVAQEQDGFLAMREDERGNLVLSKMTEASGAVSAKLMNRLSRTPPVLAAGNISAMTAVIPSSQVELFGYAQFAVFHAGRTIYVPLYLGATATPRVLLDGTIYQRSTTKPEGFGLAAEAFEDELDARRAQIEAEARAQTSPDAARRVLTEGCLELAGSVADYLADGASSGETLSHAAAAAVGS